MDDVSVNETLGAWLHRTTTRLEAIEKRVDELINCVRNHQRRTSRNRRELRLDDLSKVEVDRLVAAEGKRLYGNEWLKITERR